jgi:dipeptidyl aminopeptidase/acylaminoacyl peptidase
LNGTAPTRQATGSSWRQTWNFGGTRRLTGRDRDDTYVEQLVADAKAAVDAVVALGVADRDRIAVGGHRYGAFMTANLLAHADLFRAGIARSGAYNRALTPLGFQAEQRTYWQATPPLRRSASPSGTPITRHG